MAWLRALAAFLCCLGALPFLFFLRGKTKATFKKRFMGIGCRLVDLKVIQHGHPLPSPVLLVSNHLSYLDIIVLQQLEDGDLSFTPKREIARWPVIGWVTSLYDAVYIDRSPANVRAAGDSVLAALKSPRRVSIFPEGTTSDGRGLHRFKSPLFSVAEQWDETAPLAIQPVALRYRHRDGSPLTGSEWERIAWYGEMNLAPHLIKAFRGLHLTVDMICGEACYLQPGENRKALALRMENTLRAMLDDEPLLISIEPQKVSA